MLACRADEWDVNKWAWEGVLKVVSKGEECIIKLEDKTTGKVVDSTVCFVVMYPSPSIHHHYRIKQEKILR